MNRRDFLAASALPLVAGAPRILSSQARAEPAPFDRSMVRQMARDLASKPYKAPSEALPDDLGNVNYDQYRAIRFLPERALWRGDLQVSSFAAVARQWPMTDRAVPLNVSSTSRSDQDAYVIIPR